MKSNYSDTAILVFALSQEAENKRKPFMALQNLGEKLHTSTINKAKRSGLNYYHFNEDQQYGETFAERITQATETIFNKGYQNIIIIGNDTPGLTSAMLKDTSKYLKSNKNVVGLSKDGGLYLIGISKNSFDKKEFKNLAWQEANLSDVFLKILHQKKSDVVCLQALDDIDNFQDLLRIKKIELGSLARFVIVLIATLFSSTNKIAYICKFLKSIAYQTILGTRGSPNVVFHINTF